MCLIGRRSDFMFATAWLPLTLSILKCHQRGRSPLPQKKRLQQTSFPHSLPRPLPCTKTIRELPSKMGMSHVVILVADQTRIYPQSKRLSSVTKEQKRKTSHWRTSIKQFLSRKRPSCCSQCAQAHCTLRARTHARHLFLPLFFSSSLFCLPLSKQKKKYTR